MANAKGRRKATEKQLGEKRKRVVAHGISAKDEAYIRKRYYDISQPGSFAGSVKLWKAIKQSKDRPRSVTQKVVQDWLEKQEVHNIHKTPKRNFKTEKIIVGEVDEQWDGDLLVFTQYAKYNKGYRYIGVFIDLFSRYVWLSALKTKGGKEMVETVRAVFAKGRKCKFLRTDRGSEWTNKHLQEYLRTEEVKHLVTYSPWHAGYVERAIRTAKGKLFKYFAENRTFEWYSVLQELADSLNATEHSSTGMAPKDITVENEREVYEKIYLPVELEREKTKIRYKFNVGDKVRISVARGAFQKGYMENYSREIFVIAARLPTVPPRYRIKDWDDEIVLGSFYEAEMIPALVDEETLYTIEKILKYKTIRGKKHALVKWEHYSDKFNSWVPYSDVKKYKGN